MNRLDIEKIEKFKDYLVIDKKDISVVFSTAENNRSFNRSTEDGVKTLNNIKNEFNVDKVLYLKQIHSDKVFTYKEQHAEEFLQNEGDAIITNKRNIAIGVFTADCVPIILMDETIGVIAAIHSGWKGTFNSIVKRTIENMIGQFNCDVKNIKVYIGPHIRKCCYEVSEELKNQFLNNTNLDEKKLFNGRLLSLEEYILNDLRSVSIEEDNINILDLCTYCNDGIKLHSYRKSEGAYGRLFAFVINK